MSDCAEASWAAIVLRRHCSDSIPDENLEEQPGPPHAIPIPVRSWHWHSWHRVGIVLPPTSMIPV
jgi:hypothetical protein